MKVAFGWKAHTGWAALVVVGRRAGALEIVERRRVELVDDVRHRQPYHAAEHLKPGPARELVRQGIEAARRIAIREVRAEIERERGRGNEAKAMGILVGNPMPEWSVDEIRAVHVRMHKAEGVLFRDVLFSAADACRVRPRGIPEPRLAKFASDALGISERGLAKEIASLGRAVGPPWAKDQRDAALAAWVALEGKAK